MESYMESVQVYHILRWQVIVFYINQDKNVQTIEEDQAKIIPKV